jgi:hypothetical protein
LINQESTGAGSVRGAGSRLAKACAAGLCGDASIRAKLVRNSA